MSRGRNVGVGVYRLGVVAEPSAPRRRSRAWRSAVLVVGLAAHVGASRGRAGWVAMADADRDRSGPGAPVEHAVRIAGGDSVCALTRGATGDAEVVCAPPFAEGEVPRGVPCACTVERWAPSALAGGWVWDAWPQAITVGVTPDGRAIQCRASEKAATAVPLSPGAPRDRLVEVRSSLWWGVLSSGCDAGDGALQSGLVVRTASGTLLADAAGGWAPVPGAPQNVRSFAVDEHVWYAASADGVVSSGRLQPPVVQGISFSQARPIRTPPQVREAREVVLRGRLLCVRGGRGDLRCLDLDLGVTHDLVGLAGGAVAVAVGDDDLCVRDAGGAWWCARGPAARPLGGALDLRVFRRPPLLAGAEEVAFARGLGCARWPAGDVRCWGPATHAWPRAPGSGPLVALTR